MSAFIRAELFSVGYRPSNALALRSRSRTYRTLETLQQTKPAKRLEEEEEEEEEEED
jgi:hypothetical protein